MRTVHLIIGRSPIGSIVHLSAYSTREEAERALMGAASELSSTTYQIESVKVEEEP